MNDKMTKTAVLISVALAVVITESAFSFDANATGSTLPEKVWTSEAEDAAQMIPLADLRQFAAKGYDLVFEDFNKYKGQEVGSGLYILHFTVEGGYTLLVGGGSTTGKPFYAYLSIPGVEGSFDIRFKPYHDVGRGIQYADIDDFISKYPVPNELSAQIYGYLDAIMSSPSLSSATGDYVKAHQAEYDTIVDMGVTALPALTGILNADDMSLRGNISALLVQDIVAAESGKSHSEWTDDILQSAASDVEQWRQTSLIPQKSVNNDRNDNLNKSRR